MRCLLISFLIVLATGATAFAEGLPVFVSIQPQKYFVERVAGELASVEVMVSPGASPATYEPRPRQMAALSEAKIYFAVGAPFESVWLPRFAEASPNMALVHTEARIQKMSMARHVHHDEEHVGEEHEHAEEHGHEHHGEILDPHVWVSPPLVRLQAEAIRDALVAADPANAAAYQANFAAFAKDIDALDAELLDVFAKVEGRRFMVFHPAWGYFAQAYGLEQVPIEVQGGEPSPRELAQLSEFAQEHKVGVVFVQPQFSKKSAEAVAKSVGAEIAIMDPLAEDWPANLRRAAEAFRHALR